MTLIHVPKPPKSAANQDRPISDLLKMQILHLHEVEKKFPPRMHSGIYINDIKTEGEAANYIRHVTAILHPQGTPKPQIVRSKKAKRGRVKEIAAAAARKSSAKKPKKKTSAKTKSARGTKRK